jgi:predicted RNA polymerase sigma factor
MLTLRRLVRVRAQVAGAAEAVAFRAPPPRAASSRLRAVVYGDMGESEHRVAKSPG